jgi:hypothetical protein
VSALKSLGHFHGKFFNDFSRARARCARKCQLLWLLLAFALITLSGERLLDCFALHDISNR